MTARVELYRDDSENRAWRWRYRASNGRVLANGGQGYSRRVDCLAGCASVLGGEWIANPGHWTDGNTGLIASPVDDARIIPVRDLTAKATS